MDIFNIWKCIFQDSYYEQQQQKVLKYSGKYANIYIYSHCIFLPKYKTKLFNISALMNTKKHWFQDPVA